jgi:hypothetical protein
MSPKCNECGATAVYYVPEEDENPETYWCEKHGVDRIDSRILSQSTDWLQPCSECNEPAIYYIEGSWCRPATYCCEKHRAGKIQVRNFVQQEPVSMKTYDFLDKIRSNYGFGLARFCVNEALVNEEPIAYEICEDADDNGNIYWYLFLADGSCCSGDYNIIIPNEDVVIEDDVYLAFVSNGRKVKVSFTTKIAIDLNRAIRES